MDTTSTVTGKELSTLRQFIGRAQMGAIREGIMGEEGQHFADKLNEVLTIVSTMPKTYETQDTTDKRAYLHYFTGSCDWYIFERDVEEEQHQAFGWANLGDDLNAELGYISIREVIDAGAELDLYFTPITLSQIQAKGAA